MALQVIDFGRNRKCSAGT